MVKGEGKEGGRDDEYFQRGKAWRRNVPPLDMAVNGLFLFSSPRRGDDEVTGAKTGPSRFGRVPLSFGKPKEVGRRGKTPYREREEKA